VNRLAAGDLDIRDRVSAFSGDRQRNCGRRLIPLTRFRLASTLLATPEGTAILVLGELSSVYPVRQKIVPSSGLGRFQAGKQNDTIIVVLSPVGTNPDPRLRRLCGR